MTILCGGGIVSAITMVLRETYLSGCRGGQHKISGPGTILHNCGFRDNPGCS